MDEKRPMNAEHIDAPHPTPARGVPPIRFDVWLDRAKTLAGGFSVRIKILGIILGLIMVLGLGITWQVRSSMISFMNNELDRLGQSHAAQLAEENSELLATNDIAGVTLALEAAVAQHADSVYAFILGPDGEVVAHTFDDTGFPPDLLSVAMSDERHLDLGGEAGVVHNYSNPILNSAQGVVFLGLSEARLLRAIDGTTLQLLVTTVFVGVIGAVAATLLTWLLTRPILDLVHTTRRIGQGDLSARATIWAEDEIGSLATSINQMVSELESNRRTIAESRAARTRLLEQLIGAQEDERKRIARDLHDTVGQALSSIMLGASLIERSDADQEQRTRAVELRKLSAETLEQVRRMSRELRPSVLDDLGLAAALDRYAAEFRLRYPEIVTDLHCDLPQRLPPAVETGLYRVVQEGMTNVARHSGARTLSVLVTRRDATVRVIVEDDGVGFDPAEARRNGQSVGIHGMDERIELLNGSFDIESSDSGTTVYVEILLDDSEVAPR